MASSVWQVTESGKDLVSEFLILDLWDLEMVRSAPICEVHLDLVHVKTGGLLNKLLPHSNLALSLRGRASSICHV